MYKRHLKAMRCVLVSLLLCYYANVTRMTDS